MNEQEKNHFIDTVAFATYANKAMIACLLAGCDVTEENVARALGNWVNPESEHFDGLILGVTGHVREVLDVAKRLPKPNRM